MNTSSCRVIKSERYAGQEESFYCFKALRKVRAVADGLFWKPILKVMRRTPNLELLILIEFGDETTLLDFS
jgi:hypothetical protein